MTAENPREGAGAALSGTRPRRMLPFVAAATAWIFFAGASAQEVSYRGSLQYSTGSYVFTERTHSLYLFSGLGLAAGPLRFDASVPLVLQNSALVTWVGWEPLPTGGPDHEAVGSREPGTAIPGRRGRRSASGTDSVRFRDAYRLELGDPTLDGSAELYSGTGAIRSILVSGGVKAPVADLESGVGTGEWDFSAGTSLAASVGEFLVFGDLSYWWFGDLPDLKLEDGFGYGVGLGRSILGGRASVLGTVTGAESVVSTLESPLSLSLSVGTALDGGRQVSAGISAGLTESSPDFGVFVGWVVPL